MGGTQSTSKVVNTVNEELDITNTINQNVSSGTSCSSTINLDHCDLTGAKIEQDAKCVSVNTAKLKSQLETIATSDLEADSKATAEAVGQQISLTTGTKASTDVENVTNLMKSVANEMSTNVANTMDVNMTVDCHGSNIKNSVIKQEGVGKMLNDTVANSKSVVDSIDKIVSKATGESKAKTENTLAAIIMAVAMCLAAVFLAPEIGVAALGAAAPPQFTLAMVTGICTLMAMAFVYSQYAFRNSFWLPGMFEILFPQYKGDGDDEEKKKFEDATLAKYKKIMRVFYAIFAFLGLFLIYIFFTINKTSGYSKAAKSPKEVEMAVKKTKQAWGKFRKSHFGF